MTRLSIRPRKLDLEVDGRSLEAVFYGPPPREAPTLVLLHEGLGSVSTWRTFPADLHRATGLGVLVYSRFGYGRSAPVELPRPLTYMHDEALEWLPKVLDAVEVRRALLVGHSDGGSIALIHAGSDQRSESVEGLLLMAPHVFCESVSVEAIEKAGIAYETGDLKRRLALHHRHVDIAFWGWNRAWLDSDFLSWNIEEFLPGVGVPVTVLQGDRDPYGTWAQVESIEKGVSGPCRSVGLLDVGHAPWREAPEATIESIQRMVHELF